MLAVDVQLTIIEQYVKLECINGHLVNSKPSRHICKFFIDKAGSMIQIIFASAHAVSSANMCCSLVQLYKSFM